MLSTLNNSSCIKFFCKVYFSGLYLVILSLLIACTSGSKLRSSIKPRDQEYHKVALDKSDTLRSLKLYINEGSSSPMPLCSDLDSEHDHHLSEALYIAKLQGSKAVVKAQCLNQKNLRDALLKANHNLNCTPDHCSFYDTYRRGPLWFAYYMALMNQAFTQGEVSIRSKVDQVHNVMASQLKNFKQLESQEGQGREVYRQQVKFKLNKDTNCVAFLKLYRDQEWSEKTGLSDRYSSKPWSSTLPSSGDLWAEARPRTEGGYEVLLLERRYAKNSENGEMLERELLCTSSNSAITILDSDYRFMTQEINRDTMRIYVTK